MTRTEGRFERAFREMSPEVLTLSGVICSVVIAIAIYFVNDTHVTEALAISMIGAAISIQLGTRIRLSQREREDDALSHLLTELERHRDVLERPVLDLVRNAALALSSEPPPAFVQGVTTSLLDCRSRLLELAEGRLQCESGNSEPMLEQCRRTTKSIHAVTDAGDLGWWTQGTGSHFFDLNVEAKKAGAEIERIFILTDAGHRDELLRLAEHHENAGFRVWLADEKDLDRELLRNFTIFDGVFLHEDQTNFEGDTIQYVYSVNPGDIERFESVFARIRTRSVGRKEYHQSTPTDPSGTVPPAP